MLAKISLLLIFLLMIFGAVRFEPVRQRSLVASRSTNGIKLKLMTWNIGYAELEKDTRAHDKDLIAVADTILEQNPDVVALQELTGEEQLNMLLGYLNYTYLGAVARSDNSDRVEAILIKNKDARFENVQFGDKYALAATFRINGLEKDLSLISAHADAFVAAKRRVQTENAVDWAQKRNSNNITFIAGDFNFEIAAKNESNLYTDNLKNDSEAYSYLLKYFRDLGREAGDTAINDRRIDYIFAPPEIVLLKRAEILKGAVVGRMDHMPLTVEVEL